MVEDVDGNRYLDFMAGIAVCSTGYGHPKVVAAVKDAADRFLHICGSDFYYEGMAALCERLARIAPGPSKKRVFLTNSGTEAVEGAIKLARYATRRTAIIAFRGAFHGRTTGAVSLTSQQGPPARRLRAAAARRAPRPVRLSLPLPVVRRQARVHARLPRRASSKELFARHLDPHDVAAIFVEPIQGEGGYVVPPPGCLRGLRDICDRHGILLVADEVQCGVGRTGKMWACDHEGVEPDILLTAKGLGSGMPIGAIIAKESISTWESGSHGSTFGGNPVCCAAALATLDLVEGGLMANAVTMGERLLRGHAAAGREARMHRRRPRRRPDGRRGVREGPRHARAGARDRRGAGPAAPSSVASCSWARARARSASRRRWWSTSTTSTRRCA